MECVFVYAWGGGDCFYCCFYYYLLMFYYWFPSGMLHCTWWLPLHFVVNLEMTIKILSTLSCPLVGEKLSHSAHPEWECGACEQCSDAARPPVPASPREQKATVIKTEWHPITGVRAAAARCSTHFKRWSLAAIQTSCLTNDIGQKGKSVNTELLANTASGRPGIRHRRSRGNQNNKGEGRELKRADWWAQEALRTLL